MSRLIATLYAVMSVTVAISQSVLVKIDGNSYTAEEFDYIYNKNGAKAQIPISKEEYLDLFIDYKLKTIEAHNLGLDTMAQYVQEIETLERELAVPYLTDSTMLNIHRVMLSQRMDEEIDASHILVAIKPNATSQEIQSAYKKALEARERVIAGEDFVKVALEVSDDPSVKNNGGRLGYFSALSMVWEFESMAYSYNEDDVTPVFTTSFGYHFMKIHDRRPYRGKIQVAHIMKILPQDAEESEKTKARRQIDSLYTRVMQGDDFAELARRYSEDHESAIRGGVMPWFGQNEIVAPFGEKAFSLKSDGDVSEPFETPFGLHIVKRLGLKAKISDKEKTRIFDAVVQSKQHPLSRIAITAKVEELKNAYNYRLSNIAGEVIDIMVSSRTEKEKTSALRKITVPLALYDGGEVRAETILKVWKNDVVYTENFAALAEDVLMKEERNKLLASNAEFRNMIQEYKDGFLVYEINNRYIWNDNEGDTTVLRQLYESNKARYAKEGTFEGDIYFFESKKDCAKATKNNALAPKLAYKVVSGAQQKKGIYGDVIWNNLPNEYILVVGKRIENGLIPFEQALGRLSTDYHQIREFEYSKLLRKKYLPKVVGKLK